MVRSSRSSAPERASRSGPVKLALAATPAVILAVMLATALTLLALSSPALADDSGVSEWVGGGVYPLANSGIRMEAETVQAICYRNFAEYRVDFRFVNDGPPQTLQLGFSSADVLPPEAVGTSAADPHPSGSPIALRAWQDGKPLQVTAGKGKDPLLSSAWVGYYLHTATFPRGETMITVSYLATFTSDTGPRLNALAPPELADLMMDLKAPGEDGEYRYWLHTGAYWKGPIGKAIVRYRLADSFDGWGVDVTAADVSGFEDQGATTSPESYVKLDDRTYQWAFDNLEPTPDDDIVLAFTSPRLSRGYYWGAQVEGEQMTLPAGVGAVPVTGGASERLGPNMEWEMPPGWEAIDGSPDTAWGFSAKSRDVQGQWLRIGVRGNQNLREIRILPGRNDTLTSFKEYARPKTLSIDLSNGTSTTITLKDEPSLQRFAISGTAKWVILGVMDVYPGTKSNDVYISEIDLGNAPAPEFDTFSNMIAGGTPPTTEAVAGVRSSTTSSAASTTGASITGGASTTSVSFTTQASTAGKTGSVATTGGAANPGGAGKGGSTRPPWAAIAGAVVAAIALGVLIYLVARLRRRGKASNDRTE